MPRDLHTVVFRTSPEEADRLSAEADRLGVTRAALCRLWLRERLRQVEREQDPAGVRP